MASRHAETYKQRADRYEDALIQIAAAVGESVSAALDPHGLVPVIQAQRDQRDEALRRLEELSTAEERYIVRTVNGDQEHASLPQARLAASAMAIEASVYRIDTDGTETRMWGNRTHGGYAYGTTGT